MSDDTSADSVATPDAVYFGCWGRVGHYYYLPNGRSATYKKQATEVTPWGWGVEDLPPQWSKVQGEARLHHKDGWTALAVHDYTVDHRGNSKSVFCFRGRLTFEEALAEVERVFPTILARVGAVRLVHDA